MAHSQYNNQFQQPLHSPPPPVQTQNLGQQQQHHQQPYQYPHQQQGPYSPQPYQPSPVAMSPTMGVPPAKRQRLSPNPPSPAPYQSPFSSHMSPYATSPYTTSPPGGQHLSLPQSPASAHPVQSFHQPQPYQHPNATDNRATQSSMPPPKVPYSKAQDNEQLEKANPRDIDVNNISDVLTGSGIDLRAEEDHLLMFDSHTSASQGTNSTLTPNASFGNWSQASGHGAFQGSGPLSQSVTEEQLKQEHLRKHEAAARVLNESAQQPLTDPFLFANILRHRVAKKAYEQGVSINLEGLFDKIPDTPRNTTATVLNGGKEAIAGLQADSLLNHTASLVEILSLLSLAAEDRVRTVLEDSFTLAEGRRNTSHGIVPPSLAELAAVDEGTEQVESASVNISKTAWEAPDSAVSPMTVTAGKQPPNAARLPTPPNEPPPTPQSTVKFPNHIHNFLKRRVVEDEKFEQARIAKRQKRLKGTSTTPADTPTITPLPPPDKMTKKERDRINKMGQTEEVLHRKANETASMALGGIGGKKKYAWMSGGGGGSGASAPRLSSGTGLNSGTATPAQPQIDQSLKARKRTYGSMLETTEIGERIQIRDIVHVLEHGGWERKTLTTILARIKNTEKDERPRPGR